MKIDSSVNHRRSYASQPENSVLLPKLGQTPISLLVLFIHRYSYLKAIFIATANGLPKCKAS